MATVRNRQCWLLLGDVPTGPFTIDRLHQKLAQGEIAWQTPACDVGDDRWYPLLELPDFGPSATSVRQEISARSVERNRIDIETRDSIPNIAKATTLDGDSHRENFGEWSPQTLATVFRGLVAGEIALTLFVILLHFVGANLVPELDADPNQVFTLGSGVVCLAFLVVVPAMIASWVGLLLFRDWGRRLYVASVAFMHFVGIGTSIFDVSTQWQLPSSLDGTSNIITGAIIAMAYCSTVAHEFRRSRIA